MALAAVAGATSLTDAIERTIRGGVDTDTVVSIAGSLTGAVWSGSAVPRAWKREWHGWPGSTVDNVVGYAKLAVRCERSTSDR